MKFHFIMLAWGKEFTESFLDTCLPNHLTPENLFAFADEKGSVFKIYTTVEDMDRINTHPMIEILRTIMPVEIKIVEGLVFSPTNQNYDQYVTILSSMSKCHKMAIDEANEQGAVQIFLAPDTVMTEGSFKRLKELAYAGKRVVSIPQIRVEKEKFLPAFHKRFMGKDGFMPAGARPLTRLALTCLHPMTKVFFHDSDNFFSIFWYLGWRVGDHGILLRCTGFHPIMINPVHKNASPVATVDLDYTFNAVPDYNNYYIVTDSDEIMGYEFSPSGKLADWLEQGKKFNQLTYAREILRVHHEKNRRKVLRKKIRIHANVIDENWKSAEDQSDLIVDESLALVDLIEKKGRNSRYLPADKRTVVIFGAGVSCFAALVLADRCGLRVEYIVDDDKTKWGSTLLGHEVADPKTLYKRDFDFIIVAAQTDKKKIFTRLKKVGFLHGEDFFHFRDRITTSGLSKIRYEVGLQDFWQAPQRENVKVTMELENGKICEGFLVDYCSVEIRIRLPQMFEEPVYPNHTATILIDHSAESASQTPIVFIGILAAMESDLDADDEEWIIATFKSL